MASNDGNRPQDQSAKGKEIMDPDICNSLMDDIDMEADDDEELILQFLEDALNDEGTNNSEESSVHSSSGSSSYKPSKVDHFVSMGFKENMVVQAIKESGEDNDEAILNNLLTYAALADRPVEDALSSNSKDSFDDLSDCDSSAVKENEGETSNNDKTISILVDMGYQIEDVKIAIERCGDGTPIDELADFIKAAEIAKEADVLEFRAPMHQTVQSRRVPIQTAQRRRVLPIQTVQSRRVPIQAVQSGRVPIQTAQSQRVPFQTVQSRRVPIQTAQTQPERKRKVFQEVSEIHRKRPAERREEGCSSRKLMIGYGVPGCIPAVCHRKLPDDVVGPPYFYYENVALTPKGVWERISRFLYDIEPEFVDSIHFSAAARKRGYVHNLPISDRQPLLPIPPKTIHEAMPDTKKWWPSWDKRTKLNCLLTCIGSAQLTERIRKKVQSGNPSEEEKKWVIEQCKKWNLVWVGKCRVAVLEPEDMEKLLGFPEGYTRGLNRTDRYKTLGNSFQIDTVAYHLSVLRPLYPNGMNVLSLFSGIGGAEIALHKLGITLKNVVSVESSKVSRKVLWGWWKENGLVGELIHINDVQEVDNAMIDKWVNEFNGFDLVIGGSPCNNLAGGNRRTRDGLDGEQSSLFYQYYRILEQVRHSMKNQRRSSE